jgi:hypothetical protein
MVVPTSAVSLVWTFDLSQGSEPQDIAEFSIWMHDTNGGPASQFDMDNLAQNGADAWSANQGPGGYSRAVSLRNCTVRCYQPNGHTLRESIKPPTAAWVGTAAGASLPWETSLCVSEYAYTPGSFTPDQRRKRGRYYLPPFGATLLDPSNSGFVDNTIMAGLLADQKTFVNALGANPGDGDVFEPCIFSRADSALYKTTHLVVDAKIDSQRRRQNREIAGRINIAL